MTLRYKDIKGYKYQDMNRLQSLHNKTQDTPVEEQPFNPTNILLQATDIQSFFADHNIGNVVPRNINLYRNAFVHKSYCIMKNDNFESGNAKCPDNCLPLQEMSYERLEFLGDAILGMVVAQYLYERYPDQPEGFLSKVRTKIVNGKMLGYLAEQIGFPKFAIISKQVEDTNGRDNFKIMEDIFEAFIGAIYTDFQTDQDTVSANNIVPLSGSGFFVAELWIVAILEKYLDFAELIQQRTNFKDTLVRYMQCSFQDAPRFLEMSVITRDNKKVFKYCVRDRADAILGTAEGYSRKEAENMAARAALLYYNQTV